MNDSSADVACSLTAAVTCSLTADADVLAPRSAALELVFVVLNFTDFYNIIHNITCKLFTAVSR
jgi:hypothetical protein